MKVFKLFMAAACVFMIAGIIQAKVIHTGNAVGDTLLVIQKTNIAPKIDGKIDPIWRTVDGTWMEYLIPQAADAYPSDWSDCSGWIKLMYDDNNIYGLFYVQDNVIDTTTSIDWQMDGIEFYIDANHTHTTDITVNQAGSVAYQFNMRPAQNVDSVEKAVGKGLKYNWFLDDSSIVNGGPIGYYVQFQFPLDSLGITTPVANGKQVSIQFQIDDNDLTAEGRIHIMNWHHSPGNTDWQTTAGWGDAEFSSTAIDTNYVFMKTSTPPVIDGNLDAVWDQANQATMNYLYDETLGNAQSNALPTDEDFRFYGLYDNNNIYGFFTVYDDVIDTTTSIDWQMDGVEFYTDANHTHTTDVTVNQAGSVAYQFNMRPAQKVDSVEKAIGRGLKYAWTWVPGDEYNDTVFSAGRSYWRVEFQMNLDSLGFNGKVAEGNQFSFQLQTDDNDLTTDGRVHIGQWWHSAGNNDWQQTMHWGNAEFGPSMNVSAVKEFKNQVVTNYRLEQNYPNPFNPTTNITYSIKNAGKVRLSVYNVLGQQVALLVNEVQHPGMYSVEFNAENLSSGIYFYRMETANESFTKKMILMK